jgi:hypothetical protein
MFQPTDRYAALRDLLKRPLAGNKDMIALLREIGYAVLFIADDLATLRDIRATLANINRLMLEYMQESLTYRKKRIEKEGGNPEEVTTTQDLIQKLNERGKHIEEAVHSRTAQDNQTTLRLPDMPDPKKSSWMDNKILVSVASSVLTLIVIKLLTLVFGAK